MLKGDLVTTPLPSVLRQLADGAASGCLHVDDGTGGKAKVFLRGGQVYAVQVPGSRPQLGARLVSSGALGPEALAEALEAQRTELQGWRLGELLVHLGYVDQPVVEAFIDEQLRESAGDLLRWPAGSWKFRVNERTREDVAPPTPVEELLASVAEREQQWTVMNELLHGPDAVPMLSSAGETDAEMAIDPDAWSLLCKVDGVRSIADLAGECGFTLFEAGLVVYTLVRSGLLEVEETIVGPEKASAHVPAEPEASMVSRLAAAFSAPADEPAVVIPTQAEEIDPSDIARLVANALRADRTLEAPAAEEEVDASVGRVSQALSAFLGDHTSTDEMFAAPKSRRPAKAKLSKPKTAAEEEREKRSAARAEASARRRAADSEELARAQAELEATRAAEAEAAAAELAVDHEAEIVSLEDARKASDERAAAEAEAAAEQEAARVAAEERARVEAELRAAQEAEEAARVAAEQAAAEEERRLAQEEAARLAAEQEAERIAAEQAEAARIAAELAVAEERALAEAELRLAQQAEEAARVAAEQEAARLAEEEAARVAAEQEAARVAEEEEEAARVAAELAAAEERARIEEEIRAAAEEQARIEQEAARLAAEEEAARLAAEEEAARLAEEEVAAERALSADQRLHVSDAFAELSATAATAGDTLVVEAPVETELVAEDEEPHPTYPPEDTDMASLFRELSSLGLEDGPAPATPRSAPRPVTNGKEAKKKKGLFGR